MQRPSAGGIQLQLGKRPDVGTGRVHSKPNAKQVLYMLLMTPGLFFTFLSFGAYPPVDMRFFMGVMLCTYVLGSVLLMLSLVRKRQNENPRIWQILYVSSAVGLLMLAILLHLNGGLDRSLKEGVRTTVIRKAVVRGRHVRYNLTVSSWRPTRSTEDFYVPSYVFDRAVIGKTVTVEVHKGYFDIPWRGKISPE